MYSICNIVCGFKFPRKLINQLDEISFFDFDGKEISGYKSLGVQLLYHGAGINPIICGNIIHQFDECETTKAQQLIQWLTPTEKELAAAQEKINFTRNAILNLNAIFIDMLKKSGEEEFEPFTQEELNEMAELLPKTPDVQLVWSTS